MRSWEQWWGCWRWFVFKYLQRLISGWFSSDCLLPLVEISESERAGEILPGRWEGAISPSAAVPRLVQQGELCRSTLIRAELKRQSHQRSHSIKSSGVWLFSRAKCGQRQKREKCRKLEKMQKVRWCLICFKAQIDRGTVLKVCLFQKVDQCLSFCCRSVFRGIF